MSRPYEEFQDTALWDAIKAAVLDMEENQDLEITTVREFVIGYFCQELAARKVIRSEALRKPAG